MTMVPTVHSGGWAPWSWRTRWEADRSSWPDRSNHLPARGQPARKVITMAATEVALTAATVACTHATYALRYKDTAPEDMPHHRAYRTVAAVIRHVHRRVRIVAWNVVSILPIPMRRVTHGEEEGVE